MIGIIRIGNDLSAGISSNLRMASVFQHVDNLADTGLALGLATASTEIDPKFTECLAPGEEFCPEWLIPFLRN